MNILFIGGTGVISFSCVKEAIKLGHNITLITRGIKKRNLNGKIKKINTDYNSTSVEMLKKKLSGKKFDCVINFLIMNKKQAMKDILLFKDITDKYFFISTASCYQRKNNLKITEKSKIHILKNKYIRDKIESENLFIKFYKKIKFPIVIIRPGHIYNFFSIPTNINGYGYEILFRLLHNKPAIIHNNGKSNWSLMHADDFAYNFMKLIDKKNIKGQIFNIASSKFFNWINFYTLIFKIIKKPKKIIFIDEKKIKKINHNISSNLKFDKSLNTKFNLNKMIKYNNFFKEKITLEKGLRKSIINFKKNIFKVDNKKNLDLKKIQKL